MEHYEELGVPQFHGSLTSTVSASPEQGNFPGGPASEKKPVKIFLIRLKWCHLIAACLIIALLIVVIVLSLNFGKKSTAQENVSCLPSAPVVKLDYIQDPDFAAAIVFFWPWSPVMENTSSPMYEETISKAEYWVTKIFQTSSLSFCIRSVATAMTSLGTNILVLLKLHVSCDSVNEIEVNRAYIEGHSILQSTQYKSCMVNISKIIHLEKWRKNITITDPVSISEMTVKGNTGDGSCLPSAPRVKLNSSQYPDFAAEVVFFWPWSPIMENTSSLMYEELISKAEYWVTKIFETSSLSSCIRSSATEMMGLGVNIMVKFKLYVSCDNAAEIEVNRAYIEGHSLLQRTEDKSCMVNISKNIHLKEWCNKITTTDPVSPSEIPDTICGQSQLYPVPKIVGGRPVNRGQYPWVVKLEIKIDNDIRRCGGTIWDYNHILTAAHCFDKLPRNSSTGLVDPLLVKVIAGNWEFRSISFCNEQERRVASGRIHTGYKSNDRSAAYDVAVLRLAEPLNPTQLVMKVCHPDAKTKFPEKGIVAGWGITKSRLHTLPVVQQSVELTLLDQSDCKKLIRHNGFMSDLPNGTLCAIDDDLEERDTCQGDAGGPLFANMRTRGVERYTIFGVVSYTYGCDKTPGVYVSVPYYLEWIQNTIQFLKLL